MDRRPDPELARAIANACREAGITQKQVAAGTSVDQTTVSGWMNGKNWPPLWALPVIDELCGQPRGHLLRASGYVDDDVDVAALLSADKSLDADGRGMVVRLYRMLQDDAAASRNHSAKS